MILEKPVVLLTFLFADLVICGDHEKQLYKDLMDGYDPLVRPVRNESEPVTVTLGMDMQQIVDIEEKTQIMITNVWLKLEWTDIYLEWDPAAYGGVSEVRLPINRIWKPDILLYNSADTQFDSTWPTNAVVYSSGYISWIPPGIIKSTCKIDVAWFPFDDQHCPLKFGSWTYAGGHINLLNGTAALGTYTKNGEWKMMEVASVRNTVQYECCPEPYYDVTFTVWVRRRTLYYTLNLVVPSTMISAMTLLGFTLPPESGEKLTLGVTIFMSLCVFLLMAAEAMPQTSDAVPLISTYFSCIMVVVSASVVFTVIVLNYHHRSPDTHEMSPFVRHLFLEWLPWLLMMKRPGTPEPSSQKHKLHEQMLLAKQSGTPNHAHSHRAPAHGTKSLLANVLDLNEGRTLNGDYVRSAQSVTFMPATHHASAGTLTRPLSQAQTPHNEHMLQVLHELRFITERMRQEDDDEKVKCDWRFAAMVVDRMCLVMFTTFLVISTAGILFSAPHISA